MPDFGCIWREGLVAASVKGRVVVSCAVPSRSTQCSHVPTGLLIKGFALDSLLFRIPTLGQVLSDEDEAEVYAAASYLASLTMSVLGELFQEAR